MSDKLFIDCEFNGFGGQLMSMALVAEDGREWYEVLPEPNVFNEWVYENVLPILGKPPVDREFFRASLKIFLEQFKEPVIFADWYTDLAHLFESFAGRDHQTSFSIPLTAVLLKDVPELSAAVPHNALSDARALRDWYCSQEPKP